MPLGTVATAGALTKDHVNSAATPVNAARRTRKVLAWAGVALGVLIGAMLLALALLDWNALKRPIERLASAHSGREIRITGPLEVHVWSWTPSFSASGLTVANPPWEGAKPMAQVERLQVQIKLLPLLKGDVILPRVEVIHPTVYLHRDATGRANWTFANTKPTNAPAGALVGFVFANVQLARPVASRCR